MQKSNQRLIHNAWATRYQFCNAYRLLDAITDAADEIWTALPVLSNHMTEPKQDRNPLSATRTTTWSTPLYKTRSVVGRVYLQTWFTTDPVYRPKLGLPPGSWVPGLPPGSWVPSLPPGSWVPGLPPALGSRIVVSLSFLQPAPGHDLSVWKLWVWRNNCVTV